jgi:hypothetical protein
MIKEEIITDFQNKMSLRVDILNSVSINYNYTKHLFMNFKPSEIGDHWGFIRHNLFKMLTIDLAKLFVNSSNQKVNLFKLFEQLEDGKYKDFKIDKKIIEVYKIKLRKYRKFFKEIQHYRDKLFAHTEINAGVSPLNVFFLQLNDLINLSYEILNEISLTIIKREYTNVIDKIDLRNFKVL